jgi:glutamate/tyrosine decarboxylase-like PLP-dependent enzyme
MSEIRRAGKADKVADTADTGGISAPGIDADEFRKLGYRAVDMAVSYIYGIREEPVFRPMSPDERRELMEVEWSPAGADPDSLLDEFQAKILPFAMGNGHPRFFGWVNSPPAPLGMIGEFLAAVQGPAADVGDISSLYLETGVIKWLAELMGFPADTAMGLLVSGGSMATLTSLTVARQWVAEQDGWDVRADGLQAADRPRYLFYLSDQAHSSVTKAVELLGFGNSSIRKIPVDDHFRMDAALLAAAVAADWRDGYRPLAVVASAGTTNTGAVDPLDRIADICAEQGLWMHVDGAYGAFGVMHPELADLYAGLSRANSITLDPHKWLSVPIECGCALVRDRALMRRTFSLIPPYLRTEEGIGVGGPPSYAEYGFQQTRSFRSLKFWMTLQHMGREGFRAMVIRHVELARLLAAIAGGSPDFELMAPVTLSVVCFRYVPPGGPWEDGYLDQLNRSIEAQVQTDGRVFLTATTLRGRLVLRACVLHYGTTQSDIKAVADVVRQIGLALHQEAQHA